MSMNAEDETVVARETAILLFDLGNGVKPEEAMTAAGLRIYAVPRADGKNSELYKETLRRVEFMGRNRGVL